MFFSSYQKLTAGLLVFLFLITPLRFVLADEVIVETPTDESATSEQVIPEEMPTEQASEDPEATPETPVVDNPQDLEPTREPDKIRRKSVVEPNNVTGALNYEYPIAVVPGRNNLQPDLGLTYNSQAIAIDSIISQGWSISIPSIERINRTGAENLYTGNYFNSSLSDELVSIGGENYVPKIDNGNFISYSFSNNIWIAIDKQGTRYTFGGTINSRQDDPINELRVFKWMLNEIRDTNDNYIKYEYTKDSGQIYPDKIKYTGHGGVDGTFEIQFILQPRSDVTVSTQPGFVITTNYKLQEIQVKINTLWVTRYVLNYDLSDNGVKLILNSITESGKDENNTITSLPPEHFDYQTKTKTLVKDLNWTIPLIFEHNGEKGVRMFDANGDGLVDMVQSIKHPDQSIDKYVYINNGSNGWVRDDNWTIPIFFVTGGVGPYFEDINGDGLVDLIQNNQGFQGNGVYLNNGNGTGWTLDTTWTIPAFFTSNQFYDEGVRLADINGDGLVDFIKSIKESSINEVKKVFLNTGSGWEQDLTWTIPIYFSNIGSDTDGVRLVDVNGDGNVDLVKANASTGLTNGVYLNNGNATGWTLSSWSIPVNFYEGLNDMGVRMLDMNGDGLIDLAQSYKQNTVSTSLRRIYINNGLNGWNLDTGWGTNENCAISVDFTNPGGYNKGIDTGDVNGDGLVDIIQSRKQGVTIIQDVFISSGKKADLMSKITISQGAQTTIQYKGSPEYRDISNNLLNPKLLFGLQTVSNISVNDGFENINTTNYTYANGKYYFGNYLDRKFSGFGKVTVTDNDGNVTTTSFHGGTQNEPELGQYQDHISKMGRPYRVEAKDVNGNLYSKSINKWDRYDLGNGRSFVKLIQTVESVYDGNTSHKDRAETYDYNNTNGNQTNITQWGEVTGADNGTFSDLGSDKYLTTTTYATNTSNGVIGLPATELITDQNAIKITETRHYYDNLPLGQVNAGNETKQEAWKTGAEYINTEKTYNSYGLVISEKDPRDKETTYTYDSYNLYPTTVTNPLNQVTTYAYDYSSGKVKQLIDQNGRRYTTIYDGLDRVLEEYQPYPTGPNVDILKTLYQYTDTPNATRVKQTNYLDATNGVEAYTYFDGLDRKIQERAEAAGSNQFSVRDFIYTQNDLLLKESLPYFSNGSARTPATTTNNLYTNYTYDPLKRVVTATTAVGTTTNTYDDWKTTVTDAKGKIKDLYRDAHDNLVRVDEHNSSSIYTTTYEWTGLKKLKKITDALANVRNFSYDGLGRVLMAEDLHDPSDYSFGVWNYSYDDASNLSSRIDPNGQVVNYSYDDLNRLLIEDFVDPKEKTEVSYGYDNCAEGIGRLCSVTTLAMSSTHSYNALGQVIEEIKIIDSLDYTSGYSYDRQGNQILITNPDGSQVKYIYDLAGMISQIQRKEANDPSFIDVISLIDYNPVNLPTNISFANGAVTTNTYDANELYRLRSKVTTANSQDVQDLTYTYDPVGNITQIIDDSSTQTAKTTDYTYDDLHRLTSATITDSAANGVDGEGDANQTQTFSYDAIGNILNKSDVGDYIYGGTSPLAINYNNPHAVTSAGHVFYSYDNNGNMTAANSMSINDSKTMTWDYNNRLMSVTIGGGTATFDYSYDQDGQRIKSTDSQGITIYATKEYSVTPDGVEKHIFLGDTAIATVTGENEEAIEYDIHADHLTGSNVITNTNQEIDELTDYYAFGTIRIDEQNGKHNEKRKFTGHEYDVDTGLTYANARYYDAKLGRWLSQDPVFGAIMDEVTIESETDQTYLEYLSNPQNLNSYSYVINNPLRYQDITGETYMEAMKGFGVGMGQGLWGTVKGMTNSALHPIKAGKSIINSAVNGGKAWQQLGSDLKNNSKTAVTEIKDGLSIQFNEFMSKSDFEKGRVIGRTTEKAMEIAVAAKGTQKYSIESQWENVTLGSKAKTAAYHLDKHVIRKGLNKSLGQYTKDARGVYKRFNNTGQNITLKNGTCGIKIKTPSGAGGIYTKKGKIVSSWY